jgi:hypothetical protein
MSVETKHLASSPNPLPGSPIDVRAYVAEAKPGRTGVTNFEAGTFSVDMDSGATSQASELNDITPIIVWVRPHLIPVLA